jgi:hypothetical protein
LELYIAIGISRYHTCGCCVAIATQQPQPPFATRVSRVVWTWRHLAAGAGMSKIRGGVSGLHNQPACCGESEAYASDLGSEEEEFETRTSYFKSLYFPAMIMLTLYYVLQFFYKKCEIY